MGGFSARAGTALGGCAEAVAAFARAGLDDALRRAEERFGVPAVRLEADALAGWTDLPVVAPHAAVGPAAAALSGATGLPAALWDERLSSSAVNRMLVAEADHSRAKRARVVDRAAAAWTLQAALDATRPRPALFPDDADPV